MTPRSKSKCNVGRQRRGRDREMKGGRNWTEYKPKCKKKKGEAWERSYFIAPSFWAGYAIVNLNNHMAVGASQALAMWEPTQWWPDDTNESHCQFCQLVQLQLLMLILYSSTEDPYCPLFSPPSEFRVR